VRRPGRRRRPHRPWRPPGWWCARRAARLRLVPLPQSVGGHRLDADDPAIVDEEVSHEAVLEDGHGGFANGGDEGGLDHGSRGVAARVQDSRTRVRGLPSARERSVLPVEFHAQADEVPNAIRPLGTEDLGGGARAEPGPGGEGVVDVRPDAVVGEQRRGDAALGIAGVALAEFGLGHERDRVAARGTQGGDEPRNAGAHDDHAAHGQSPITAAGSTGAPGRAASIRSRATRAGAAIDSGTEIWFSTSPRTSASSTQAR
jgi:hypothetical protein